MRYTEAHNDYREHYAYVTIDGVDCLIQEPTPFSRGWYSHKFKHAGVRYILAVSLFSGEIMYLEGPFPCGHWSDVRIYRYNLKHHLHIGEMVVADKGYRGEPTCITPYDAYEPYVIYLMSVARARHEGVNAMFKQFRILKDMYRHHLDKHSWVFKSVALLVQMKLIEGRGSYQIIDFTVPPITNVAVRRRHQNMFNVHFGNVELPIDHRLLLAQLSNDEESSNDNEIDKNENENETENENENENENEDENENENVPHEQVVVRDGLVVQEESRLITQPENMYPASPFYSSSSDNED